MKHKVTMETETKKYFLGIPYTVTEKQTLIVDGKTYKKMKQEERDRRLRQEDELAACAAMVCEEELVELFGE